MLLNIIFLIIYIALSNLLSGAELYFLLSIHFIIYVISDFRKNGKNIYPITLFGIGVVIVNFGNISLIDQLNDGTITTYSYIVPAYINDAAQIWCISCTLIVIGFQLFIKKSLPTIRFDLKDNYLKYIYIFLLVSNVVVALSLFTNIIGSTKTFALLNTFAILFFARLWATEDNKSYRNYAISLVVVETFVALTSSYLRSEVALPILCLFIGYFIGKGEAKYLFSYRIIPYLVIGVVFAATFSTLEANRSNFINVFYNGTNNDVSPTYKEETKKNAVLIRSANVAQITNVVKLVKRNGFYDGKASAPLIIAMVPRILWPEKPIIQLGAWYALEIGQANQSENGRINNSINMTVMGELYLDFGWLGVVIGSLLLGGFLAVLWNSTEFYASDYNITGAIFGGYLFVIIFTGIAADLEIVITFVSSYVSFYIVKRIAKLFLKSRTA